MHFPQKTKFPKPLAEEQEKHPEERKLEQCTFIMYTGRRPY